MVFSYFGIKQYIIYQTKQKYEFKILMNMLTSSDATSSSTRIWAFKFMARFVLWTFGIDCTLGSAIWWRTNVFIFAWANGNSVHFMTTAIQSTRWWSTHIDRNYSDWFIPLRLTWCEWIASKAISAYTSWYMVDWQTFGIQSTDAWTRIFTFIAYACFVRWTIRW